MAGCRHACFRRRRVFLMLDHVNGEAVEGMDSVFRIVPVAKYQDQPRLTTTVKRMTGRLFRRNVDVEMPIFRAAWEHAQHAFANSGVPAGNTQVDILVQEYPRTNTVCFVFYTQILGRQLYVTAPFTLSHAQIGDLTLRGLWAPHTELIH